MNKSIVRSEAVSDEQGPYGVREEGELLCIAYAAGRASRDAEIVRLKADNERLSVFLKQLGESLASYGAQGWVDSQSYWGILCRRLADECRAACAPTPAASIDRGAACADDRAHDGAPRYGGAPAASTPEPAAPATTAAKEERWTCQDCSEAARDRCDRLNAPPDTCPARRDPTLPATVKACENCEAFDGPTCYRCSREPTGSWVGDRWTPRKDGAK